VNARTAERRILAVWSWGVAFFVVAPLFAVLAVSLTPLDYISMPTRGLSLRWYEQLSRRSDFGAAALNSVMLAAEASLTALALGTLAAIATARYRFPLRESLRLAITSPLFIPVVLGGLAILVFANVHGITDQAVRLYVAHTALTLPYVFRTVLASLTGYDMNQEYAARNLGASPAAAFVLVTLPQIMPGLMAAVIFAFIVSFDNVALSIFLTGKQFTTLPVELFTYTMNESDPMAAALSVAMIAVSMIAVLLLERLFGLQKLMN
jgi:putative spermidine/putrescine transport system permease protein